MGLDEGRIVIFPGRFQPFHNGHFDVLRKILLRSQDFSVRIVLGAIINQTSNKKMKFHGLETIGDEHHDPVRNPFTLVERIDMLNAVVSEIPAEHRSRLLILGLPRPELNWELICSMFSCKRSWIVPKEDEAFDEEKARFFSDMNDSVIRIAPDITSNGRVIREYLKESNRDWEGMVPRVIASKIRELGFNGKQ